MNAKSVLAIICVAVCAVAHAQRKTVLDSYGLARMAPHPPTRPDRLPSNLLERSTSLCRLISEMNSLTKNDQDWGVPGSAFLAGL